MTTLAFGFTSASAWAASRPASTLSDATWQSTMSGSLTGASTTITGTFFRFASARLPRMPSQFTGLTKIAAGPLLEQVRDVVLLLQAVELRVQGDQPVAVRGDHPREPLVQIDEERVVHRLERHDEEAAGSGGGAAGFGGRGCVRVAVAADGREGQDRRDQA